MDTSIKKKQREIVEKLRNDWITGISHDIKTPLSSIKGFAEILKDSEYDSSKEEVQDYATIIYDKSLYLGNLVEDLNLTYKLKNDYSFLSKKNINLVKYVKNIIIGILNHPDFMNRNIEFNCSQDEINYSIESKLMKRALMNIIFNSLYYNDINTQIFVYLTQKSNIIELKIIDNGKGIPKKDLPYIFEKYYRGTNTKSKKGSGLGLAISKDIINAHNGKIGISSEENKGTEIVITFHTE